MEKIEVVTTEEMFILSESELNVIRGKLDYVKDILQWVDQFTEKPPVSQRIKRAQRLTQEAYEMLE